MDFAARVHSLQQQSRELSASYEGILHRTRRLREETNDLTTLRAEIAKTKKQLLVREAHLSRLKIALPHVARKEELERFTKRVNAMPFEHFASSPSVSRISSGEDKE